MKKVGLTDICGTLAYMTPEIGYQYYKQAYAEGITGEYKEGNIVQNGSEVKVYSNEKRMSGQGTIEDNRGTIIFED